MLPSPTEIRKLTFLPLLAAAVILASGCNGSTTYTGADVASGNAGPAFVEGTDAPMASVTSFTVQIESIDAVDASGNSVSLLSGTPTVDFARYNGLQALLDMNDVPAGSYSTVNITLGAGTIGYLNTSGSGAPTIQTEAAAFTTSTVSISLSQPLVVAQGGAPVGLRVDFDLGKSIEVDNSGAITGTVDPTFHVTAVTNSQASAHIDEFVAGVISVNANAQSFIVQGPHGEQFTINVNGQTEWDGGAGLSSLNSDSIVQLAGQLDHADQTLDADEVALISDQGFFADGQVTYVQPSSGAASDFDLYVRALLPASTGLQLGQIAQVNLTGSETFGIYWMHNAFTQFLFNSSSMVAGQHVAIGGDASGAANANAVTVNRVTLQNWGFNGTIVAGSENASQGTFEMQVNGFAGVLIPETITVYLGNQCDFRYGLSGFSDLTDGASIRVVGLLLKDSSNGQVVLLARHVDGVNLTDMTTAAWQ